jgi:hypothetical protein
MQKIPGNLHEPKLNQTLLQLTSELRMVIGYRVSKQNQWYFCVLAGSIGRLKLKKTKNKNTSPFTIG